MGWFGELGLAPGVHIHIANLKGEDHYEKIMSVPPFRKTDQFLHTEKKCSKTFKTLKLK